MNISIIIGIIAIIIPAGFSIWNNHRTTNAREERSESAYEDIVNILVKNLVEDDYIPSFREINFLIETKKREKDLEPSDLPSVEEFIKSLYARIEETLFLVSDKKMNLLKKINDYLEKRPSEISEEKTSKEGFIGADTKDFLKESIPIVITLATLIALLATSVYLLYLINKQEPVKMLNLIEFIIPLFVGLMTVLSSIRVYYGYKKEEKTKIAKFKSKQLSVARDFEEEVYKTLGDIVGPVSRDCLPDSTSRYLFDFCFDKEGTDFFVEVKFYQNYVTEKDILNLKRETKDIEKDKNRKILIANEKKYLSEYIEELKKYWDYVKDLSELKEIRNAIAHGEIEKWP